MQLDRRDFLSRTSSCLAAAASSPLVLNRIAAGETSPDDAEATGLPADWRSIRKIDCHMHITPSPQEGDHGNADVVIEGAIGFGTHIRMAHPGPALVKLQILGFLSPEDRERIAWRSAAEFIGIEDKVPAAFP